MKVFELRNRLVANYGDFVRGFFHIQDERIHDKVEAELKARASLARAAHPTQSIL
jgi:hypothetical protein